MTRTRQARCGLLHYNKIENNQNYYIILMELNQYKQQNDYGDGMPSDLVDLL